MRSHTCETARSRVARFLVVMIAFAALPAVGVIAQQAGRPGNSVDNLVYNAGWYMSGSTRVPCYWSGTRRIDLAGDGVHDARARACAVSAGTVFSAGWWNDGTKDVACYWSGTTRTDLVDDQGHAAQATSIAVLGDAVYVGGQWFDGTTSRACYWQGAQRVDLDSGNPAGSGVWSIVVSDRTVYTAGWRNNGSRDVACFWTGTRRTDLDGGTRDSYANAMTVSKGIVYSAGAWDWDGKDSKPCYWVGARRTNIASRGGAWTINVSNGVVTAGGARFEQNGPIPWLWTNNALIDLGDSTHHGFVCSSASTGGVFCPSGFWVDGNKTVACYWHSTYRVELDDAETGSMAAAPPFLQ